MILKNFGAINPMKTTTLLTVIFLINTSSIAALGPLNHLIPADDLNIDQDEGYFYNLLATHHLI